MRTKDETGVDRLFPSASGRGVDPSLHRSILKVPAAFLDLKNQAGEVPELVRSFGARVIDLAGFEVYGREHAGKAAFDYAFYEKHRPFHCHY